MKPYLNTVNKIDLYYLNKYSIVKEKKIQSVSLFNKMSKSLKEHKVQYYNLAISLYVYIVINSNWFLFYFLTFKPLNFPLFHQKFQNNEIIVLGIIDWS